MRGRVCSIHAAELRLTLEQLLDEPVRIEIPDAALERAGSLWAGHTAEG